MNAPLYWASVMMVGFVIAIAIVNYFFVVIDDANILSSIVYIQALMKEKYYPAYYLNIC